MNTRPRSMSMRGDLKRMSRFFFAWFLSACLCATALATSPCQIRDKNWFKNNVSDPSDLVIHGKVISYSGHFPNLSKKTWTKIKIIEVFKGPTKHKKRLKIQNWQANFQPLYGYEKGDEAIFWLKRDGKQIIPTNLSWHYCTPSIWPQRADGAFIAGYDRHGKRSAKTLMIDVID